MMQPCRSWKCCSPAHPEEENRRGGGGGGGGGADVEVCVRACVCMFGLHSSFSLLTCNQAPRGMILTCDRRARMLLLLVGAVEATGEVKNKQQK